jgi:hypothetical protein
MCILYICSIYIYVYDLYTHTYITHIYIYLGVDPISRQSQQQFLLAGEAGCRLQKRRRSRRFKKSCDAASVHRASSQKMTDPGDEI